MKNHQSYLEKNCLAEWLITADVSEMYAVTLTMKQSYHGVKLDDVVASKNLRHFLNIVNQSVFGNAFRRYKKSLKVIPVLELSAWDRLHYHLSIEKPERLSEDEFISLIKTCWSRVDYSRSEMEVSKIYSDGWIKYCLKGNSPLRAIDIENLQLY